MLGHCLTSILWQSRKLQARKRLSIGRSNLSTFKFAGQQLVFVGRQHVIASISLQDRAQQRAGSRRAKRARGRGWAARRSKNPVREEALHSPHNPHRPRAPPRVPRPLPDLVTKNRFHKDLAVVHSGRVWTSATIPLVPLLSASTQARSEGEAGHHVGSRRGECRGEDGARADARGG